MLKTVTITLLAMMSGTAIAAAQEIKVDIKVPGYTEADAMVAIDIFRRNCRPLGKEFWGDITQIEVTIEEEIADFRRAKGWQNSLWLRLHYSDNPNFGPGFASGTGVLAGHTLHYNLGGGDEPGFFASKRSSQYLCGLSFNDKGEDIFVGVPQMKFLDR